MESLLARQSEILENIKRIDINFRKDPEDRKTPEYFIKRIDTLDNLWKEFDQNDQQLSKYQDKSHEYFIKDIYVHTKTFYEKLVKSFTTFNYDQRDKGSNSEEKVGELMSQQHTHFRAFQRLVNGIQVEDISEKWEIEDELRSVQSRWNTIDCLHLQLDNILQGSDANYEAEFIMFERSYKNIKRRLNHKLAATSHMYQATPQLEIPVFTGKYSQWPTFFDLFNEAIHSNNMLNKSQKMQHLKGKLKGEAERLIQHLHITAENYDSAWEILQHRYNNKQLLFTNQIEILLNQPTLNKQASFELKRLHDTTMECIHAIENLGVDTTNWDPLIVHLISKKLDAATYSDYKESRKSPRELPVLSDFMKFLEEKFLALEPLHKRERDNTQRALPSSSHTNQNPNQKGNNHGYQNYKGRNIKNYQATATRTNNKCLVCDNNHELCQCKKFINMTPDAIMRTISKHEICKNCLYKHYGKPCLSNKTCKQCGDAHNSLLHDAISSVAHSAKPPLQPASATWFGQLPNMKMHNVNHVASENEEILLTTITLNVRSSDGTFITLRALLDQGSQISLISENAAQRLGLPRRRYNASISGIGVGAKHSKGIVDMTCRSIYDDYELTTQALVISKVIGNLPNVSFNQQKWPHLNNINLADPGYNISKPIDLLLDASIYSQIIMSGLIKGSTQDPIAQQTKLGWILSGNVQTFKCHVVINNLEEISKYWELEDISPTSSTLTIEEEYCESHYQSNTRRLSDGRYEVALPMKPDYESFLGSSKPKALAQFRQLEKKMENNQSFSDSYKQFMADYEQLGHMRLQRDIKETDCFLPHHGVLKVDSTTTKLRTVFNASAKTSSGKSLNDLMECGPNLQQDLPSLILKWRIYKYAMTADIEKMFRQINVSPQYQHLQSIIWRSSVNDPLKEYHLTTVTYGTKAAPYLAMRTLKQLADDDKQKYPLAAPVVENQFYMDDVMCGHNSLDQAKELQRQLIIMLKGAGMNLRKWSSNHPELIQNLSPDQISSPYEFRNAESRKTLGLNWTALTDEFTFVNKITCCNENKPLTKRELLSNIAKIFDPLGWIAPITVRAKILFQNIWKEDTAWDDELSPAINKLWAQLYHDLQKIHTFKIPRYVGNTEPSFYLHGFCDASERALACSVYVVTKNHKGEYTSRLVVAKTKLSPIKKKVTLPRLELCGALLLAQLIQKVLGIFPAESTRLYAWTDSKIVLGWLHGDLSKWNQFVGNRVQKILDIIPSANWSHVKSEENAADCATRGLAVEQLKNHSLWWEGPEWLIKPTQISHKNMSFPSPSIETKRMKTFNVNAALCENSSLLIMELLYKHSSMTRIVNIIAWVSRFIARLRNKCNINYQNALSSAEINNAYQTIIKVIQTHEFEEDIHHIRKEGHVHSTSKLLSLNPFVDENGLLRVGGRLNNSYLSYTAKHPIILSNHSRLTELIINEAHLSTLHGGPKLTLSYIRERYWITSGIRTVKRQLRQCVKCRRFNYERRDQIMAALPQPRVTPSRPFAHTGVDFTGYVDLKASRLRGIRSHKGYVAVFICLSTKAVHLELVSDLSTSAFLAAFNRFRSRRGTPSHVYSDNGTNFVGASRVLKQEYQSIISALHDQIFMKNISQMNIEWHFNAPSWPSAGGLWEAGVRSLKYHLKRVIGEQKLTYEEFTTLLYQIEACLNSRPLCTLTEDPEDDCLTPGHFLIGSSLLSRPLSEPENVDLSKRWQLLQAMTKQFWKAWSTEYLHQLQERSKWRVCKQNLNINDVVLIKEENLPPGKWALGRVVEIHPGTDGNVRVVTLKAQNKLVKRPITKLSLLPVNRALDEQISTKDASDPSDQKTPDTTCNQEKKAPRRKTRPTFMNYFTTTLLLLLYTISPSVQESVNVNISSLRENQMFYFDKVADLQYIKDDWKLITYYNMSTYWSAITNIEHYVSHIRQACEVHGVKYLIVSQLEHELQEIEHYDSLLKGKNSSRSRRGLINAVGYVANSLFGVLDDRFAEQYQADIEKIKLNENHLKNLIRNQTSIIETEFNILRRTEDHMNKQFVLIQQNLRNMTNQLNKIRQETELGLYITSSALTANIIISKIRRIQQILIDTVTDISHGHINTHLLTPEQLQYQLNVISGQLKGDLTIPIDTHKLRDVYKLLQVSAKVFDKYLITEIKIPLVSYDTYELDHIISIPTIKKSSMVYFETKYPYVAYNLQRDLAIMFEEKDLQTCMRTISNTLLCSLSQPIYNLKTKQSLCELDLLHNISNDHNTPRCDMKLSPCEEQWIKLQRPNAWLYYCCQGCAVRIFCKDGVVIKTLEGNGMLTLGQGCTIKSSHLTIFAHNDYFNQVEIQKSIEIPNESVLNTIINATLPEDISTTMYQDPKVWGSLKAKIDDMKEQTSGDLTIHDVHQYAISYTALALIIISAVGIILYLKFRLKRRGVSYYDGAGGPRVRVPPPKPPRAPAARVWMEQPGDECSESAVSEVRSVMSKSLHNINQATSPELLSVKISASKSVESVDKHSPTKGRPMFELPIVKD